MRDSFSGIERRFLEPYRSAFAWLTSPIVTVLAWLRLSPNFVSFMQIPVGVAIVLVMPSQSELAFMLFLSTLFIDSLDGALARRYGVSSSFGALVDQICDHVRETLVILAVALIGALHLGVAVLYPLIYALFNFTLFLCNYRGVPVPWAIKSLFTFYPALFLYTFFGINVLTLSVGIGVALMVLSILIGLNNLRQAMD